VSTAPPRQPTPTTYAELVAAHDCEYAAPEKQIFLTVMEDGQIALIIAHPHPDGGQRLAILEHLTIRREDFNEWLHTTREWWNAEKRHPAVKVVK
jgi:hypothetical protein